MNSRENRPTNFLYHEEGPEFIRRQVSVLFYVAIYKYIVTRIPIARQRVGKHIHLTRSRNNRTSIAG
jgi:hypothetical protein